MRWKLLFAFVSLAAGLALAGYSEYCCSRSGPSPVSAPIPGLPAPMTRIFCTYTSARYRIGVSFDEPDKLVSAKLDSIADPYSGIPAQGILDYFPGKSGYPTRLSIRDNLARARAAFPRIWGLPGGSMAVVSVGRRRQFGRDATGSS
jgi:hypothetical protein